MRFAVCLLLPGLLAACSQAEEAPDVAAALASDPLAARALHDPLMSDPDLSALSEANAAFGFAGDSALPVIPATPEAAQAAREAGRIELLEAGEIAPLPDPAGGTPAVPGRGASAGELLAALGAPAACGSALQQGFVWAASLPPPAAIMPQGMAVRAAGSPAPACQLRLVRYHTAAAAPDVLEYHYNRALRAGLAAQRSSDVGEGLIAKAAGGETLLVSVRPTASGLTEVDLAYRKP
ncbi:MAG: hypothetical protein RSE14_00140 [Erythrobacter sp.]|jgi:hypothetical protein|uniref:hypothetical protein n=1 Tax=Erythrobacter sp. TaxID=1042 RepID=UPI002B459FBC|nr:hypothetical protein [Erythrobacter sp.]WRH70539.1 MAG: hypothetical protein RSE14_00140 [Erythrobacter sp.]